MTVPPWSPNALGMVAEIGGLSLAGFLFFRGRRHTFAEAVAYGILTVLMILSLFLRVAELSRIPELTVLGEGILACAAVYILITHRGGLAEGLKTLKDFASSYPMETFGLSLGFFILFIGSILMSPEGNAIASYPFFGSGADLISQNQTSQNKTILFFTALRWNTETVSEAFGFLLYLSVGFSTYSLARRYSWPSTAFTVTLVVVGMPKLVYQSFSPTGEIIPAAAGLFSLLALHRLIEKPNAGDFALLVPAIFFGVTDGPLSWAFPAILSLLAAVLLTRRHGVGCWRSFISAQPAAMGLALMSAVILSGGFGSWRPHPPAPPDSNPIYARNEDGLAGAAANGVRYLLESADPIPSIDHLWKWMMGIRLSDLFQRVYDRFLTPIAGGRGAAETFVLSRYQNVEVSWFGPLAFLLILPAIGYAMIRGHRRIKAVAVALVGYLYIVALVIAWKPGNGKFFTPFFTCGGFLTATLLPPWRVSSSTKRLLRMAGLFLLFYSIGNHPILRNLILKA